MKRERESSEQQSPHCPMCERPFEGIYDYPRIEISNLTVSRIPDFVRDIPHETNISEKVKRFAKKPEVKDYLKELSSSTFQSLALSDLKPNLPENKDPEYKGYYRPEGRYYLGILDSRKPFVAEVAVLSHINSSVGWGFVKIAKLAEIEYQGEAGKGIKKVVFADGTRFY